jgi:hypothetical protein
MATFTTITMVEPRHWLRAIQFLVTRCQRPLEHSITGRYTLETMRCSRAWQRSRTPNHSSPFFHPRKDFAVPIRTIFSDGNIKHNFSQE